MNLVSCSKNGQKCIVNRLLYFVFLDTEKGCQKTAVQHGAMMYIVALRHQRILIRQRAPRTTQQHHVILTLCTKLSGAVYCNRSCLRVCLCVCVCGSVTTITRNCVHRSSLGMWPRSRRLGLEAASRPSNASPRSRLERIFKRLGLASASVFNASVSASVSAHKASVTASNEAP